MGADYVRSKIGNPGKSSVIKYTLPAAAFWGVNQVGRHVAVQDNTVSAKDYLETANKNIDENPYYTDKDRNQLSKQAFHNYGKMM